MKRSLLLRDPGYDDERGGGDTALLDKIDRGVTSLDQRTHNLETKVKTLTSVEEIFSQPDRWPKELKSIAEENIKLKQTANGLDSEIKSLTRQLARMEGIARAESRLASGDPIARFCAY